MAAKKPSRIFIPVFRWKTLVEKNKKEKETWAGRNEEVRLAKRISGRLTAMRACGLDNTSEYKLLTEDWETVTANILEADILLGRENMLDD